MNHLKLYTKPNCSLCDQLKADLLLLQSKFSFSIQDALIEVNIEEDADAFERFRYVVPVLELTDGTLIYPPHTIHELYGALQQMQQRTTTES
jgi:hypothetical protein